MSAHLGVAPMVLLVIGVELAFGFNLETRIPVIKEGPPLSHFGYSVAMHKSILPGTHASVKERHIPWMLVGAPKGENLQPGTNHSGALYKCPLTSYSNDCEQVLTDGLKDPETGRFIVRRENGQIQQPAAYEIKDDQWMGVTVKSQGEGGYILVCGHRYQRKGLDEETYRWGYGLCYRLQNTFEYADNYEPCRGKPVNSGYKQFGYCQAGTSGIIMDDEIVLGVPGTHSWRGTVYSTNISADYLRRDKTQYFGVYVDDESPVDKFSYLGYSVAAGKFFGDEMTYVAGAPRAGDNGEVVFFIKERIGSPVMPYIVKLKGEKLASSFGFDMVATDVNGDKKDDLIVSAPFHFTPYSSGAVYIYLNEGNGIRNTTPFTKIEGPKGESRFGHSLASLGDLNLDGYNDIAVGAPYDKKGAIYIFLGSKDGLQTIPSQIIRAEDLPGISFEAFGYALSGGMDLDNNGYNDLLTSSFCSDRVVLLRARPIIDIQTKVEPDESELVIDPAIKGCADDRNSDKSCFSFRTCFKMMSEGGTLTYLQFRYNISERYYPDQTTSRIKFQNAHQDNAGTVEQILQLRPEDMGQDICNWELVYLKKDQIDVVRPIRFKLTYEVYQREPKLANVGEPLPEIDLFPILNQKEAVKFFQASFARDCGDDEVCQSDLKVMAEHDLPKLPDRDVYIFELGKRQFFNLNVNVSNEGEPAYLPNLYISHDKAIDLRRSETETGSYQCIPALSDLIHCKLDNPMVNRTGSLYLVFKLSGLPFTTKGFPLKIWVNSTSEDINLSNNKIEYLVEVKRRAEISISGSGEPEQVFYNGDPIGESAIEHLEDIGTEVIHRYLVDNRGPWRVDELHVDVLWPYQVENNKEEGKWLLYMTDIPTVDGDGECDIDPTLVNQLKKPYRHIDLLPEATIGGSGRYVGNAKPSGGGSSKITKTSTTKKIITKTTSKKTFTKSSSGSSNEKSDLSGSSSQTRVGRRINSASGNKDVGYDDYDDYESYDNFFDNRGSAAAKRNSTHYVQKVTTNSDIYRSSNDRIRSIKKFDVKRIGEQSFVDGYDNNGNIVWSSRDNELGLRGKHKKESHHSTLSSAIKSEESKNVDAIKEFDIVKKGDDSWIEGFDGLGDLVWTSNNRNNGGFNDRSESKKDSGRSVTKEYSYKREHSSHNGENTMSESWTGPDGKQRHRTKSWSDDGMSRSNLSSDNDRESRIRFDWSDVGKQQDNNGGSWSQSGQSSSSSHSGAKYSRTVIGNDGNARVYTKTYNSGSNDEIHRPFEDGWVKEDNRNHDNARRRVKREEVIIKAQAVKDTKTGKTVKVVTFKCDGDVPTAKCFSFRCTIRNLDKNRAATISIRSRLWNSTLIEDYPRVNYVSIQSKASLILPEEIRNDQDTSDDVSSAETIAYSNLLDTLPPEGAPLWVILVSVLAGLLLLVIIAYVLWKMGFFKRRRRPDPTLSGNLNKNGF